MFGDHAIYHEGWIASTKVIRPPWEAFGPANPDPVNNVTWELYDLTTDRSESRNLAAQYPDKVKELEGVWVRHMEEFRALVAQDLPPVKPGAGAKGQEKRAGEN